MQGYFTVFFVNYITVLKVLGPWFNWKGWFWFHTIVFEFTIACILISYFRANTTDPGTVPKGTATRTDIKPPMSDPDAIWKPKRRFCEKCQCIKPPRAHHCSTCQRCVNKMGKWMPPTVSRFTASLPCPPQHRTTGWMHNTQQAPPVTTSRFPRADHHCPWVNNCVGSNNYKFFLLFIWWTFAGSAYAALLAIARFALCWRSRSCPLPAPHDLILLISSTVLAIFFACFVVAMWCDQYEGIVTNTTAIESMKGWDEESRGLLTGLADVCGGPASWKWIAPCWNVPQESDAFYKYSSSDDPDAYDPRDPLIRRHMSHVEDMIRRGVRPSSPCSKVEVPFDTPLGQQEREGQEGVEQGGAAGHEEEGAALPAGCVRPLASKGTGGKGGTAAAQAYARALARAADGEGEGYGEEDSDAQDSDVAAEEEDEEEEAEGSEEEEEGVSGHGHSHHGSSHSHSHSHGHSHAAPGLRKR